MSLVMPPDARRQAREIAAGFDLRARLRTFTPTSPGACCAVAAEPKWRMPDGSYFLTRYDDLVTVYRDAQTFSSDKKVEFGAEVWRLV